MYIHNRSNTKNLTTHSYTPKTPTQNETTSPNLETGEKYQDGQ